MVNQTLFGQVKRKLNVTWDDAETTARIEEIIESAIPDLIHKLGITDSAFDFSAAGTENTLFLAYCLYEWNHAIADFDLNYERMIAQVRTQHEVANYLENGGSVDSGSSNAVDIDLDILQTARGVVITVKDEDGTSSATVNHGEDGKTPVKGTDYWTSTDKAEIVTDVLAALPNANGVSF